MTDLPLKVFMTDPHLGGGGQVRYVTNLARQLTAMGHAVTIGCKPGSILVASAQTAGCAVRPEFSLRGGLRPGSWQRDIAALRAYIRNEAPSLIHVSGSQDHWVCAIANRTLGRPVCLVRTRHNTYSVGRHFPNRVLNRAWTDFQIVVCDVVRRDLARHPAFDATRMCSIHNGVDAQEFKPDPESRRRAREEFGYSGKHLVCGIVARLVPAKGHEFLFRAVALLHTSIPHLRILVLGQGDLEERLRRLAAESGIVPLVRFAGFRADMAYCVQAIDLGIQPSIDCDTSSFSLKEMMAAEKPVIASDYGGLTEIVDDGSEGLVVPAGTVDPLARAIESLAADANRRIEMGKKGRERVLRDFTIEVFAARTVAAYRQAVDIHNRRLAGEET